MKKILKYSLFPLGMITAFYSSLFYFEDKLIFVGTKHSNGYRRHVLNQLDNFHFRQEFFIHHGEKIDSFIKNNKSDDYVLFLGGNAEDVVFHLNYLNNIFEDKNIYTLNYQSYGASEGKPTEANITEMIAEFIKHHELNNKRLIIIGRSLGTGFATKAASQFANTKKLILISPYSSMENVALGHHAYVPRVLTNNFMKNKIQAYEYAKKLTMPVLVIYAKDDKVVFNKHTEELLEHISNKKAVLINDEDHSSILTSSKTVAEITKFIY